MLVKKKVIGVTSKDVLNVPVCVFNDGRYCKYSPICCLECEEVAFCQVWQYITSFVVR